MTGQKIDPVGKRREMEAVVEWDHKCCSLFLPPVLQVAMGKGALKQKLMSPQGRRVNSGSLAETVFQGGFDLLPSPGLGTS